MESADNTFLDLSLQQTRIRLQNALNKLSSRSFTHDILQECQIAAYTLKTVSSIQGQPHIEHYAAQLEQLFSNVQPVSPTDFEVRFLPRLNAIQLEFQHACHLLTHHQEQNHLGLEKLDQPLSTLVETLYHLDQLKFQHGIPSATEPQKPTSKGVRIAALFQGLVPWIYQAAKAAQKEIQVVIKASPSLILPAPAVTPIQAVLIHLLRNAVVHGIEPPNTRQAMQKPLTGTITLQAQMDKTGWCILVSDDGRGLSRERSLSQSDDTASSPPSAATSGGMDNDHIVVKTFTDKTPEGQDGLHIGLHVVRAHVQKLDGEFELKSTPGQGTAALVKLPPTLYHLKDMLD